MLIVRGAANLIDPTAAADLERVRQLLDEIEGKEEIARLLDCARERRGHEDLHRIGEQAVRAVRLVGDRRALS